MTQTSINREIRRAYRKRLLPLVEQCLLGRAIPISRHCDRSQLDSQSISEILACFEGDTIWNCLQPHGLAIMFNDWCREDRAGLPISIGNFVRWLYDQQVAHDIERVGKDVAVTVAALHEKRMYLMATLFVAGYLPAYEPESLMELV